MKRTTAILLLFLFGFQLLSSVGFMVWFKVNQAAIIELFCVNKRNPERKCDGKCFMMKGLHQQEEKQNQTRTIIKSELSNIFEKGFSIRITEPNHNTRINQVCFANGFLLDGFINQLDQPPC